MTLSLSKLMASDAPLTDDERKRLLAIAKAAAVFLDDCPIGDDDKPYVTDICNGTEFRALRAALEGVEP